MDLLTQPLVHHPVASRSPPAQSPSSVAPATEQEGGASIGKHVSTDSQASIDSTTEHRQQEAQQFAQLRTAPALDTTGLEHEPRIVSPSHANGDWRVYGRVKAQCIFWHEGTLQEKGLGAAWKKSREKLDQVHEWVADGTLWITKTGEIVFVLDQHSAPTLVDRPPAKVQTLSTGSSETGEHASTTHPRRLSLSSLRRLSSRDSHSAAATATSTQETTATTEHAENEGGIRGFVHKIVSAISSSSHHQELPSTGELPAGETSGDGLRRVSTREAQAAQASRAEVAAGKQPEVTEAPSASTTAGASTAVQFEEPRITDDPLPAYKGHAITALVIGSASHIRAIRHFPLSSAETTSSSNLALSSTGLQDFLSVGGETINPPVVELDVVEWVAPADGKDAFDAENTMIRKREVTIGFAFRDVLLLHEADDFRARVEALVTTAMQAERATTPTHSLGAALMRTLSGRSLGRATSHEGSTGERAAVVQQQQQQQQQPMVVQQPQQQEQELPPSMPAPEPQQTRPDTLAHGRRRSGSWLKAHPQGDVWT